MNALDDVEIERVVLGQILMDAMALEGVLNLFSEQLFTSYKTTIVARAILALNANNEKIDLITVGNWIKRELHLESDQYFEKGTLVSHYLMELTMLVGTTTNIDTHVKILYEKYLYRKLNETGQKFSKLAETGTEDIFDLIEANREALDTMVGNIKQVTETRMDNIVRQRVANYEKRDNTGVSGVKTGLKDLDAATGGWQNTDFIVLAGRPSMGKSALALHFLKSAAMNATPTALFSLEMSKEQLVDRLIASETEIPLDYLSHKKLSEWQLQTITQKVGKVYDLPIYIDDTAGLTVGFLRAKVKRMVRKYGIKMVIIDYLQLMSGEQKGNREQEISSISRGIKKLAKECNIPIIALAQLSRSVETRGGDKKPMLSDLRESGAIENDADLVMFVYRPEYYGFEQDADGLSTKGLAQVIIAKHRNGSLDTINANFIGKYQTFCDLGSIAELSGNKAVANETPTHNYRMPFSDSFLDEEEPF
ncbi:MAG TPA: replicative DNA helicase [Cyclobacteriaceae bacterium]|nr:replicative DNA helicase [Cyclobacteriaceae bacterium]